MPYTMEDFERDYVREHFAKLSPKERENVMRSLPLEDRQELLKSLPVEDRRTILDSLPAKDRRELLESLPPEERLAGLSPKLIQEYLDKLNANKGPAARKSRRKK